MKWICFNKNTDTYVYHVSPSSLNTDTWLLPVSPSPGNVSVQSSLPVQIAVKPYLNFTGCRLSEIMLRPHVQCPNAQSCFLFKLNFYFNFFLLNSFRLRVFAADSAAGAWRLLGVQRSAASCPSLLWSGTEVLKSQCWIHYDPKWVA